MSADRFEQFKKDSYFIERGLYDQDRVERLLKICNRVQAQWQDNPLTDNPPVSPQANYMRHLHHPEYHREHRDDLIYLLDAIAEPKVLEAARAGMGEEVSFFSLSYYFNPTGVDWPGQWHKDKVFESPDPRDRENGTGIQVQIALVPTNDLQVVPGSHLRDYTDEERRICEEDDLKHSRSDDMPGALRATLQPGDGMYFHHTAIHRGSMHAQPLRRTVMISFRKKRVAQKLLAEGGLCQYSNQPWFLHPDYLDGVKEQTAQFLNACFVDIYSNAWRSELSEILKYRSLIANLSDNGKPNPFFSSGPLVYAG